MNNKPASQWWYANGDKKNGPCTSAELMQLARQGVITRQTLLWREGMADWAQASRFAKLWEQAGTPAPLPSRQPSGNAAPEKRAHPKTGFGQAPAHAHEAGTDPGAEGEEGGFVWAVRQCFAKYVDFSGRARRAEYWFFFLFCILVQVVLGFFGGLLGAPDSVFEKISSIFMLATLVPGLAAGARRLHDIGHSGWWQLLTLTIIGIIPLIIFFVLRGNEDENEYGPSPLNHY